MLLRSGFALGGAGSGVAHSDDDVRRIAGPIIGDSMGSEGGENTKETKEKKENGEKTEKKKAPAVLIDQYLGGWKEVEYEVVRDAYGNRFCVCNMENFDPLGVHTGERYVNSLFRSE